MADPRTANGPSQTINSHPGREQQQQPRLNPFASWDELRGSQSTSTSQARVQQSRSMSTSDVTTTGSEGEDSLEMHSAEGDADSEEEEHDESRDSETVVTSTSRGGRTYDRLEMQDDDLAESGEDIDDEASLLAEPLHNHNHLQDNGTPSAKQRKKDRRRSNRRRVYGGGRRASLPGGGYHSSAAGHPSAGSRGILSTSFHLFTASLSPCSILLLPYAYSLTGLSFGIPITVLLILLGQYFSHSLLVVEGRYTGSRSYHALGGSVFPQSHGLKYLGQLVVLSFQVFVDGARTLVALILATQLLIDLSLAAFPRAPRVFHKHIFISLLIGIPTLLSTK